MHETPRFAIALTGVGGCLCIAAGILITGPRDIAIPAVPGVPAAHAQPRPHLPMPSWSEVATPVASPTAARPGSSVQDARPSYAQLRAHVDAPRAEAVTAAPALFNRQSSIGNLQSPVPLMLSSAPHASGSDVIDAEHRARERGAISGAFVSAGAHVGASFKTVGRTLKRVF